MKKLSLILAVLMLISSMLTLVACDDAGKVNEKDKEVVENDKNNDKSEDKKDIADLNMAEMVAAIEEKVPYEEFVSEILLKANDPDEMVCWTYGVIDINAYDLLSDYVITMPSDYSQTLAILKFDDGMTDEDFEEVKEVVTNEYIESRSSALQMYMPEEYKKVEWALENPDMIWRQYGDNLLVLAIYGGEEPTAVWEAVDEFLADYNY